MYYAYTITQIRKSLHGNNAILTGHLLWMCDQIAAMDRSSVADCAKAGRWIGWILAQVESMGVWQNCNSRDLIRTDRLACGDVPVVQE